jgi:hypothetical protein
MIVDEPGRSSGLAFIEHLPIPLEQWYEDSTL